MREELIEEARFTDPLPLLQEAGARFSWISPSKRKALLHSPLRERDEHPSFYIYLTPQGWRWKDFATNEKGDNISLFQKLYNLSFRETVEFLTGESPISPEKITFSKFSKEDFEEDIREKIEFAREKWEEFRGNSSLAKKFLSSLGLPYLGEPGAMKNGSYFIVFPLPNPANVVGLEIREMKVEGEKIRKTWGTKTLWVCKVSDSSKMWLLTESIMDALAGYVLLGGNFNLVALNGAANTKRLKAFLKKYQPQKLLLALDNDEAGRKATEAVKKIAASEGVAFEEINEMYRNYKDLLRYHLDKAKLQAS